MRRLLPYHTFPPHPLNHTTYVFQSAQMRLIPSPPPPSLTCASPSVLPRGGLSCAAVPSEPSDQPVMRPGSWCSTPWAWCAPQQPQCTKRPTPHQERGEKWQQDGWDPGSNPLLGCTSWKLQGHAEVCRSREEERSILSFQCQWHNDKHNSKKRQSLTERTTMGDYRCSQSLQEIYLQNSCRLIIQQHIKELEYFHWQLWYQSRYTTSWLHKGLIFLSAQDTYAFRQATPKQWDQICAFEASWTTVCMYVCMYIAVLGKCLHCTWSYVNLHTKGLKAVQFLTTWKQETS